MKKNLLEIINEVLEDSDISISNLTPDMDLRDDIGLDSLNLAYLTVLIESEYGVDVFKNGIVKTVGDILEQINE